MSASIFPEGFIWGTTASAYQIEGGYQRDGKGESIWDRFSHTPGKILNNDTGDVACDHYRLFREDVKLLKELGVKSYKFSLSWPRIFPDGRGKPNQKGMDFYRRLADLLSENGIIPAAVLYHWDLPQKLQDRGGWTNRETAEHFARYAQYAFAGLGDTVPLWVTCNEPWVASFIGHWHGGHPPGMTDFSAALLAAHHLMLAHGMAVRTFREMGMGGEIGIQLNLNPIYPASEDGQDLAAAERYADYLNGWFLDPILRGRYPENLKSWLADKVVSPDLESGDMDIIHTPVDFLGVNSYSSSSVRHDPDDWPLQLAFAYTGKERTASGWEIYPEGLFDLLLYLHDTYGGQKLILTENGAAFMDHVGADGQVDDGGRLRYLHDHIAQAHRAINAGVNLAGYYVWSFLDNFEWIVGYAQRFGLVYVDYPTQRRIIKKSGLWYRDVVRQNGILA